MQKLQYTIEIEAGPGKVSELMLGKDTYRQWTSAFNPTSDFEGGWNKGDKIYFTGISKEGKKEGMVAEIAEHIPNRFVSIRHYGILDGDKEITEGPAVEKWAGGNENYTFTGTPAGTKVTVDVDVTEEFIPYFNDTYPKALQKLKELCENSH